MTISYLPTEDQCVRNAEHQVAKSSCIERWNPHFRYVLMSDSQFKIRGRVVARVCFREASNFTEQREKSKGRYVLKSEFCLFPSLELFKHVFKNAEGWFLGSIREHLRVPYRRVQHA